MNAIEAAIRVLVDLLVRQEYLTIERLSRGRRLTAAELESAVADYGRTVAPPGDGWWDHVEITPVEGTGDRSFHVAAPLWTREEGQSDLTLELRLTEIAPEAYDTEVEDLHVL